jgi:hypothetical protein
MIDVETIRKKMVVRGMTPGSVALALSTRDRRVTEREVRGILEGRIVPSWEHLVRLSHILGGSVWELIKREDK